MAMSCTGDLNTGGQRKFHNKNKNKIKNMNKYKNKIKNKNNILKKVTLEACPHCTKSSSNQLELNHWKNNFILNLN